jgi:hypothetical protein
LRPRSNRRCNGVGARIIRRTKGVVLATGVIGEQAFNTGKAGEIAHEVAPSPGPTVSSVKSAHDVTR